MRAHELPLGIDLGSKRVRMALATDSSHGIRIEAISVRDRTGVDDDMLAMLLEEMRDELGARTRQCCMALNCTEARIDSLSLPSMSTRERRSAAIIDAERRFGRDDGRAVRVFRTESVDRYAIGITARSSVETRKALARRAGLRLVRIEHECAAYRSLGSAVECVIDVGGSSTRVFEYEAIIPTVHLFDEGGQNITSEIARSLQIDHHNAELRKRIVGTLGECEAAFRRFLTWLTSILVRRHEAPRGSVLMVGNGSRVPEFRSLCAERFPPGSIAGSCAALERSSYPMDVCRAAFSDWALAIALSTIVDASG